MLKPSTIVNQLTELAKRRMMSAGANPAQYAVDDFLTEVEVCALEDARAALREISEEKPQSKWVHDGSVSVKVTLH